MSATVRTTCPRCGTIDVPVRDAALRLGVTDADPRNTLYARCPSCAHDVVHPVTERGTRLLAEAGITVTVEAQQAPVSGDDPAVAD